VRLSCRLDAGRRCRSGVESLDVAIRDLIRPVHERPSLRPLAPLLGVLVAMWLAALALLAEHVL
jgi:hypothetical protein